MNALNLKKIIVFIPPLPSPSKIKDKSLTYIDQHSIDHIYIHGIGLELGSLNT